METSRFNCEDLMEIKYMGAVSFSGWLWDNFDLVHFTPQTAHGD